MGIRVFSDQGAAKFNEAVSLARVSSIGPLMIDAQNQGANLAVIGVYSSVVPLLYGAALLSDKDTAVSAEDTGYDGNGADLAFSGQTLNGPAASHPCIPGTLLVVDVGATGPDLVDLYGNGSVYTNDADLDIAGVIDYFTGALTLAYPAGKAPSGQLNATYVYQDVALAGNGARRVLSVANIPAETEVTVRGASNAGTGTFVRVDVATTWG